MGAKKGPKEISLLPTGPNRRSSLLVESRCTEIHLRNGGRAIFDAAAYGPTVPPAHVRTLSYGNR